MTGVMRIVLLASTLAIGCGVDARTPLGVDARAPLGVDAGTPPDVDTVPSGEKNAVPMIVNAGLPGTDSFNAPFVSITICEPGTMNCQTIGNIEVDTGASGVRVFASALTGIQLPQQVASDGRSLVECMEYVTSYAWGSVKLADVRIGGELAAMIPIQVIADPAFPTVPTACSNAGASVNTVATFGSLGTIGINQIVPDCGPSCTDTTNPHPGDYYSCNGADCAPVAVPVASQVSNPIAAFGSDSNGAVLTFPSMPSTSASSLEGALVFGIGTAANNALGASTVLTVNENGELTTLFEGITMAQSYIDSGTEYLEFFDDAINDCNASTKGSGYYCPAAARSLTAQNVGNNGVVSTVSFTVANANTLFASDSDAVFDELAAPGPRASFVWGFPFFIGRSVFVALDGASTPGGDGPYVGY
jgi:hypothetical protein